MKQFNLEEYLKNPSRKVVTRDGRVVKIHCTNFHLFNQSVIAEIEDEDVSFSFNRYGQMYGTLEECPKDLFFAPEKHEGWVNVYPQGRLGGLYGSTEEAKQNAVSALIATVKIEWEE